MGGAAKAVGAIADTAVSAGSFGTVKTKLKDGKTNVSVGTNNALKDSVGSITGEKLLTDLTPVPVPPTPTDEGSADTAAKAAAANKLQDQKLGGINSTMLGGSVSADNSNLKKKKLLGE